MSEVNFILATDAYKETHWSLLPKGMTAQASYIESRGVSDKGVPAETLVFGPQAYAKYLANVTITPEHINYANEKCRLVFGRELLHKEGWMRIANELGGKIPIKIMSVKEGTLLPCKNVIVYVETTDEPSCWIANPIETSIHRATWYPTTVATTSFGIKRLIRKWAEKTGGQQNPFHLNDFGAKLLGS